MSGRPSKARIIQKQIDILLLELKKLQEKCDHYRAIFYSDNTSCIRMAWTYCPTCLKTETLLYKDALIIGYLEKSKEQYYSIIESNKFFG